MEGKAKDILSNLATLFGLLFLPGLIASTAQRVGYFVWFKMVPFLTRKPRRSPPSHSSLTYKRDYIRWLVTVVFSYLTWCTYQAAYIDMEPNLYATFDVPSDAPKPLIRKQYKKLSFRFHPDKNPSPNAAAQFQEIREAYEIISDPVKADRYQRFGPATDEFANCKTDRDFFWAAFAWFATYNVGIGLLLVLLWIIGLGKFAAYIRVLTFLSMAALELYLLTGAVPPKETLVLFHYTASFPFFSLLPSTSITSFLLHRCFFPSLVPFQKIILLHQLFNLVFIALSHWGPIVFPEGEVSKLMPMLRRLEALLNSISKDTNSDIGAYIQPYRNESDLGVLKRKLEQSFIDMAFKGDVEFKSIYRRIHNRVV